jgi:Flp pilus assembly protein TadG
MRHVYKGDAVSRMDAGRIDHETSRTSAAARCSGRIAVGGGASGQTIVEFAFIIPIFLLLMLGVVQMVVVGGAALARRRARWLAT